MVWKSHNPFKKNFAHDRVKDIDPDEIFLDAKNLPNFDVHQFEGRLERPISPRTFFFFGAFCAIVIALFFARSFFLQAVHGADYLAKSENNMLRSTVLFPQRGVIYDRDGGKLAWNVPSGTSTDFSLRKYATSSGLSELLGYLQYPSKDSDGFYYNDDFVGEAGVEKYFNSQLAGENGSRIVQIDAAGRVQSSAVEEPPIAGSDVTLSIDTGLQSKLYQTIASLATSIGFTGGAGVIMDVHTGEVLAMASFPEYDSQIMTDRTDTAAITSFLHDPNNPFLDRVTDGLYAPGSIVKPYMAMAALMEHVIDPSTKILSTGSISVPNPYDPAHPSVFNDWRPQGWIDMEQALAVSSDVYFYEVGGGYENQQGLDIDRIDAYMNMFGFGKSLPAGFFSGAAGTVPSPAWKAANFNGASWLLGDTYHTAIGQYGFQVTPIQMVRAVGALANGGKLMDPSILKGGDPNDFISLNLPSADLDIVRTGMEMSATTGVASGLDVGYVKLAAKTGTAQLGSHNQYLNSWVTGFFPYDNPQYAFAVVMEQGPATNDIGGVYVMRQMLDWMKANRPQYLGLAPQQ